MNRRVIPNDKVEKSEFNRITSQQTTLSTKPFQEPVVAEFMTSLAGSRYASINKHFDIDDLKLEEGPDESGFKG